MSELTTFIEEVRRKLEVLAPIFATSANVHNYTQVIGFHTAPVLRDDMKLGISSRLPLQEVKDAIINCATAEMAASDVANITKVLKTINPGLEVETKLEAGDLLVRTWQLAVFNNETGMMLDNLTHNIKAGGGCLAGICARLCQIYLILVLHTAEKMLEDARPRTPKPAPV